MTLAEFRDHLASSIGVKGRGNALAAEDASYLQTVIECAHAELEQLGVALWSLDDIPLMAIRPFTTYCRGSITRFGLDESPDLIGVGLMQLRYLTADGQTGVGKACYF